MNQIQEKKCSNPKCLKVKPLTEFYKSGSWCKTCRNKASADWKKKNPEKLRAHGRNYHRKRVEKAKQGDLAAIAWLEKASERRRVLMKKKKECDRILKKLNAPWREGIVYERPTKKPVVSSRYLDSINRDGDSLWLNISRVLASARNARTSKTTALN